jgi:hypothetical protein
MPSAALDQSIQVELKILIVLLVDNSNISNLQYTIFSDWYVCVL